MTLTGKERARSVGVPLVEAEHEPARNPRLLTLHRFLVGGKPVQFDEKEETVLLGGDKLILKGWIELRNRLDLLFLHSNAAKKGPDSSRSRTSGFLGANHEKITSLQRGYIRPVPERSWWMRLLGVVSSRDIKYIITDEEINGC